MLCIPQRCELGVETSFTTKERQVGVGEGWVQGHEGTIEPKPKSTREAVHLPLSSVSASVSGTS